MVEWTGDEVRDEQDADLREFFFCIKNKYYWLKIWFIAYVSRTGWADKEIDIIPINLQTKFSESSLISSSFFFCFKSSHSAPIHRT